MERFNYPSLKALYKESGELLRLLEAESYGYRKDQQEKIDALEAQAMSEASPYG